MREQLKNLLGVNWLGTDEGYQRHVDRIVAMRLTPAEKAVICERLDSETDDVLIGTLTGIMETEPDQIYHPSLRRALDSPLARKRRGAMRALLRGGYTGAMDLLFEKPPVQDAMGDELPWEIWGAIAELSEPRRQVLREAFCRRFTPLPPLDAVTRQWLRMLVELPGTNERVVGILLGLWGQARESVDQLAILEAMVSGDDSKYEPVFEEATQSKVKDLRELGKLGLKILAGEMSLDQFRGTEASARRSKPRGPRR